MSRGHVQHNGKVTLDKGCDNTKKMLNEIIEEYLKKLNRWPIVCSKQIKRLFLSSQLFFNRKSVYGIISRSACGIGPSENLLLTFFWLVVFISYDGCLPKPYPLLLSLNFFPNACKSGKPSKNSLKKYFD